FHLYDSASRVAGKCSLKRSAHTSPPYGIFLSHFEFGSDHDDQLFFPKPVMCVRFGIKCLDFLVRHCRRFTRIGGSLRGLRHQRRCPHARIELAAIPWRLPALSLASLTADIPWAAVQWPTRPAR